MPKRILVGSLALCAAVSFVVPRNAAGQASAPAAADSELVGELAKQLGSSTQQAEGAAGALFGLAKTRLKPEEFAKITSGVPEVEGLLKAAPAADSKPSAAAGAMAQAAGMGELGGLASVAGTFTKLGLKPGDALKAVPVLTNFVGKKGGAEAAKLLAGALK